jgi:hypothetical protein
MNVGDRVTVAGAQGWPDNPGEIEAVSGVSYLVRLDEKHADGSPYTGWPWCHARPCSRCGKMHFIEQIVPDAMSHALEQRIVEKLGRGESVADMWPTRI